MNAARIAIMSDEDMGRYASGGFGVDKRHEFIRMVRGMAKEQARLELVRHPKEPTNGQPKLHEFKVELNPNQYGYAEQAAEMPKAKPHPLDRDGDGRKGGSLPKAKRGGKK